jgi:hypothetical protein
MDNNNSLPQADRNVTSDIMQGVFSLADEKQFGTELLGSLLRSVMPELYASETRRDIAFTSALSNAVAVSSEPVRVARLYEVLPDVTSSEVQVLADLMAKNHGVQLMLLVRKIEPSGESKFKKDLKEEIIRRRKTAKDGFKGVNLRITTGFENIAAFLEGEQVRGLVYGDQGAQDLENVTSIVRNRKIRNVLMVRNDTGKNEQTLTSAAALLAAFERLFDSNAIIPEGVVNTSSLLAQYIQLQAVVKQLIGQSA